MVIGLRQAGVQPAGWVVFLVAPLALAPISRTLWTAMVVLVLPVDDPPGTGRPGAPR
jgi:hypothetical protein